MVSIEDMMDPNKRDEVVAAYKAAGLGGERYGVVCPNCLKRICLQGFMWALENADNFCLCKENYSIAEDLSICEVLETHGLSWTRAMNLKPQANMHEATVKKGKKVGKKSKKDRNNSLGSRGLLEGDQGSRGRTVGDLRSNPPESV